MNACHDSCFISHLSLFCVSISLLDSPYRQFSRELFGIFHVIVIVLVNYSYLYLLCVPFLGLSGASVGFPLDHSVTFFVFILSLMSDLSCLI
jgi:hypothetical protein